MFATIVFLGLGAVIDDADSKQDPRSTLETAIPYFIRLLEEEKYDEFIDKAMYPPRLEGYLAEQSRDQLKEDLKRGRKGQIELLREIQKLKGEPFNPRLEEYESGMQFRDPNSKGSFAFFKRKGVWYGAF
jgi:hypothetical protein